MRLIFLFVLLICCSFVNAQKLFIENIEDNICATIKKEKSKTLLINTDFENYILNSELNNFEFELPFFNHNIKLKAIKKDVFSEDFKITSKSLINNEVINVRPSILSYHLVHDFKTIGVINFYNGEVNAFFKLNNTNYEIASYQNHYVLFDASNSINQSNSISIIAEKNNIHKLINEHQNNLQQSTPVCIELAIEIDSYTRNTFSSDIQATNWALAIISGVSQIYVNELNVAITVVHSYVWNNTDPYSSYINQPSSMLSELRNYWVSNNGLIGRDIVHLFTKRNNTGTGGIAYLDVLCDNSWGYGFSSDLDNDTIYNFPNPTYSWNLKCVSQVIGHNIGSEHTHWCGWLPDPFIPFPGGIIDNCVDVDGNCANNPSPQLGTIMSECHTTSGGSSLNFHPVVLTQALNPGIANANCLSTCSFYGCTDSTAFNYDPTATVDDGSCIPSIFGCTDSIALNYNPVANTNDSSCNYCSSLSANVNHISCNGLNNGSIDLTVQNGTPPFTYNWVGPFGFNSSNEDIDSLNSGLYTVYLLDGYGCNTFLNVQIDDPIPLTVSSITTNDVTCYGLSNGNVSISVSGGTVPYSFDYGPYNPYALSQGSYTVSITDANNCTPLVVPFNIFEPGPLLINLSANNISCNGNNDGSISTLVSGGSFPFSFSWNGPNNFSSPFQDINNLNPGLYNVDLTDANGCINSQNIFISEPDILNVTYSSVDVSCNNGTDGQIILSPIGGSQPYNFIWSNGSNTQNQINVSAGNYSVDIYDNNGCTLPQINFILSQPPASNINEIISDVNCNGNTDGAIDITYFPSSAVNQFTYNWNGPNSFSSNNEDISGVIAGLYTLTIIENGICNKVVSYIVNEPDSLIIIENIQDVSCFGGTDGAATLSITGGTPSYNIDWGNNNPLALTTGNYYYSVIDSNNCFYSGSIFINEPSQPLSFSVNTTDASCHNGADGTASLFISGGTAPYNSVWLNADPFQLDAGYHLFTIFDTNGCFVNDSVFIQEPSQLQVIENISNVLCYGENTGSVNLQLSGATPPYSVNWYGFNNDSLYAGSYMYDVIDFNGCIISSILNVGQPSIINVQSSINPSSCPNTNDGSIVLSISGGTGPYIQDWYNFTPSAISSGTYEYLIIDANNCIDTNQVFIPSVSNIKTNEIVNHVTCYSFCDGDVALIISDGVPPYQVSWQGAGLSQADSLCEGVYTYQIIDAYNCIFSDSIQILQPDPIISSINYQNGMLEINSSGGTPPYMYLWWNNNGFSANTQGINPLQNGNYYCMIFDINNCRSDTNSYLLSSSNSEDLQIQDFNIYPNPSNGIFILESNFSNLDLFSFEVYDLIGRRIHNVVKINKEKIFIDLSAFSKGVYTLSFNYSNNRILKKLVYK